MSSLTLVCKYINKNKRAFEKGRYNTIEETKNNILF